jgi:hypothetical protein
MTTVRNPVNEDFFKKSLDTILMARKILAYTYPIAYYIFDDKLKT